MGEELSVMARTARLKIDEIPGAEQKQIANPTYAGSHRPIVGDAP
jgi:hypothetical protein